MPVFLKIGLLISKFDNQPQMLIFIYKTHKINGLININHATER